MSGIVPNLLSVPLPICGGPEDNDREAVLDEVDVQDEREVSVMKEDAQGGERVEVVGQGNVEAEKLEEGVRLDTLAQVDNEQGADIPIPAMVGSNEDREQLIKEQSTDESLKDIRQWAEKGERGYSYANGLLVHNLVTPSEQVHTRIVVPSIRRTELLKFAHSSILGGHFSHSKTTSLLNRRFTWPRMSVDVKRLCSQCVPCQKASGKGVGKAPLQPLPVLDVPFSKLAFDLVGPLPRTPSGHRYLLTSICLASKYPEAVPLKCGRGSIF